MQAPPIGRSHTSPWNLGLTVGMAVAVIALLALWLGRPARAPAVVVPATGAAASTPAASAPVRVPAGKAAPVDTRRAAVGQGRWSSLTPAEQVVLAPLQTDWADLTRDQRLKWFDLSQRFGVLSPDEQQRVQARMADWARLTPAERGAARLNFQEIRQRPAQERLDRWEAYQGLDADARRQLAEQGQASAHGLPVPRRSDPTQPVPKSSGAVNEAVQGITSLPRSVGATVVQAPLGATTVWVTRLPGQIASPSGGPKISATPDFVDPATLLPQPRAPRAPTLPTVDPTPTEPPPSDPPPPSETPPSAGG